MYWRPTASGHIIRADILKEQSFPVEYCVNAGVNTRLCGEQASTCIAFHDPLLCLIFLRSLKSEYFVLTPQCQVRAVLRELAQGGSAGAMWV